MPFDLAPELWKRIPHTSNTPSPPGLASTATNTAAAQVFMNWNLSKRGQQVFSDMGEYSVRSDIAAPHVRGIQLPDFDDPRVHRVTPAEAIANAADDQKTWNAIFGYNE
jgi:iron(III) transport system substrate-binding protein